MEQENRGVKRTMLHLFNLHVVNAIFRQESQRPLSAQAQQVYLDTIIFQMQGKPPTFNMAMGFTIQKPQLLFAQKKKWFEELQLAGLVSIREREVFFINTWNKHIDHGEFETLEKPYSAGFVMKPVQEFKDALGQVTLVSLICKKHGLSPLKVSELATLFLQEQITFSKTYQNEADCMRHFMNWVGVNKDKIVNKPKSSSKILGRDT